MGSHTRVCDELQLTQAPAALTVHPPQGCSHGLDGPCQLLQGSVQGVPITLQDGPKGLGDCLGEEGVTEGGMSLYSGCGRLVSPLPALPLPQPRLRGQEHLVGAPQTLHSAGKAKSPKTQQHPP